MKKAFSRVKISNIAQRAGVSVGTVDRVIHNRGEVAQKTREKILKIISEMKYEPDILARTLASRKTKRFISLIPRAGDMNPFWKTPEQGLLDAWEEVKHFGVVLDNYYFDLHSKDSFIKQLEKIIKEKPDGIIFAPVFVEPTRHYLKIISEMGIPVVFINTNIEDEYKLTFVGQDAQQSGMVAARLMDYSLDDDAVIYIINIASERGNNAHIISREEGFRDYFGSKCKAGKKQLITINIYDLKKNELNNVLDGHIKNGISSERSKGIFVTNSRVFFIADYLNDNSLEYIRLIGYDLIEKNIQQLRNGVIDFLISQKPWEQGYNSLISLFKNIVMQKEIVKDQFLPIDIITKENLDFYLNN